MSDEQTYFLTDPPRLQGEKKVLFTLVLTFAIIGVILWGLQIRNSIAAPYALTNAAPATLKQELVDNNIDYLKHIDTTGNGISDYEKIFVYGTSRYLYDSYGYGMSDKDVLQKGLPLCPGAGKNCGGISSAEGAAAVTGTTTIVAQPPVIVSPSAIDITSPDALTSVLSDPKQLRQMLIDTKQVSASDLQKISDADLLKTAQVLFASSSQALIQSPGISTSTRVR